MKGLQLLLLALVTSVSAAHAVQGAKPRRPVSGEPEWNQPKESKAVHRAREQSAEEYIEGMRYAEEARGELFRIQQLKAMAEKDPESGEKARELAASAQMHLNKAKLKFFRATELDPKNADAWNMLGYAKLRTGDTEGAIVACEKALALKPEHIGVHETMAECDLERGRIEEAYAELDWLEKRGNMATLETNNLHNAINIWKVENRGGETP
jgi:Flp pilus assembly protein TadD